MGLDDNKTLKYEITIKQLNLIEIKLTKFIVQCFEGKDVAPLV